MGIAEGSQLGIMQRFAVEILRGANCAPLRMTTTISPFAPSVLP
jgi:hypothetical protein